MAREFPPIFNVFSGLGWFYLIFFFSATVIEFLFISAVAEEVQHDRGDSRDGLSLSRIWGCGTTAWVPQGWALLGSPSHQGRLKSDLGGIEKSQ